MRYPAFDRTLETLPMGAGFHRLMEGIAVAVTARSVPIATQMYLKLGQNTSFADLVPTSQRREAAGLIAEIEEAAVAGLHRWATRMDAPRCEVINALRRLDIAVRFDYRQVETAMAGAASPEAVGWTLAESLVGREQTLSVDVIARDILRVIAKSGLNGALRLTPRLRALDVAEERLTLAA